MDEQESRKQKSEKLLQKLGSEFLPSLPLLESENETKFRTPIHIGKRILCLVCVAAAAEGLEHEKIIGWLKKESLYSELSPKEKEFLEKNEATPHEKKQILWRSECVWLLLWAVKKVERNLPTEQCIVNEILNKIPGFGSSTSEFINSLKLRSKAELLDMSDFLYRAHWATRQNEIDGKTAIGTLNPDVVQEWHYAINWLSCYADAEDWDDIPTDT